MHHTARLSIVFYSGREAPSLIMQMVCVFFPLADLHFERWLVRGPFAVADDTFFVVLRTVLE